MRIKNCYLDGVPPEANLIVKCVTDYTSGYTLRHFRLKARTEPLVMSRMVLCYLLDTVLRCGPTSTGRFIKRNHGTIIRACKRVRELMDVDAEFRGDIQELTA